MLIPKSHPRAASLHTREKLVRGYREGLVVEEGLLAHGRGEMFDYLIGEKTSKPSQNAIKAAARALLKARLPVISVNGNFATLCPKEIVQLGIITRAKIEINLFYANGKRKKAIAHVLKRNGAKEILGIDPRFSRKIPRLDSARRVVDKRGIFSADVVLVPLEDGDRTIALKKLGKKVAELRRKRGFSQEGFAHECRFHRSYMGAVERGEKNMTIQMLVRNQRDADSNCNL